MVTPPKVLESNKDLVSALLAGKTVYVACSSFKRMSIVRDEIGKYMLEQFKPRVPPYIEFSRHQITCTRTAGRICFEVRRRERIEDEQWFCGVDWYGGMELR